MKREYCLNCGKESRMGAGEGERLCLGCFQGNGYYYGPKEGLLKRLAAKGKEIWEGGGRPKLGRN